MDDFSMILPGGARMKQALLFGVLVFALTPLSVTAETKVPPQTNVVFFLIDDLGYKDLEVYGAEFYETPHMDSLAKAGMRFTDAYTAAAICAPARAASLTGIHPIRLGMWNHHHFLPDETPTTLAERLQEEGYATWHVGKWHCGGPENSTLPEDLGFDVNIGGATAWGPASYFWPYENDRNDPRGYVPHVRELSKEGDYLTDVLGEQAVRLIRERDPEQPFFLNMWHFAVHNPIQGKPELVEKYRRKLEEGHYPKSQGRFDPATGNYLVTAYDEEWVPTYAAMIESLDDAVGAVVEALKSEGIFEDTLIVFYSDNGPTTHRFPCVPLMGGKNSTYEAGVRVPAFFVWNGRIESGTTSSERINIVDVPATILDLLEIPELPDWKGPRDGVSVAPVLEGGSIPVSDFIWYFPDDRLHWAQRANAAILGKEGYKYVMFFNGDSDELYHIDKDPSESRNVIKQYPKLAMQLRKRLVAVLRQHYRDLEPPPDAYRAGVERRLGLR